MLDLKRDGISQKERRCDRKSKDNNSFIGKPNSMEETNNNEVKEKKWRFKTTSQPSLSYCDYFWVVGNLIVNQVYVYKQINGHDWVEV